MGGGNENSAHVKAATIFCCLINKKIYDEISLRIWYNSFKSAFLNYIYRTVWHNEFIHDQ